MVVLRCINSMHSQFEKQKFKNSHQTNPTFKWTAASKLLATSLNTSSKNRKSTPLIQQYDITRGVKTLNTISDLTGSNSNESQTIRVFKDERLNLFLTNLLYTISPVFIEC